MPADFIAEVVRAIDAQFHLKRRYLEPQFQTGGSRASLHFEARDAQTGAKVNLKFLNPYIQDDPVHMEGFARESELLATLRGNPNIIYLIEEKNLLCLESATLPDMPKPLKLHYLVTERAKSAISQYIYSERNNPRDNLLYFREICKGVQQIHDLRICHRDLKPSNCLIFDQVVKLIDFTTADQVDDTRTFAEHWSPKDAKPVGNWSYAALELFCGFGQIPQRYFGADMFALGAILFEMFAQKRLTDSLYNWQVVDDLMRLFSVCHHARRQLAYKKLLCHLEGRWVLPNLSSGSNSLPAAVAHNLDVLYKALSQLNFEHRCHDFDWIFRQIDLSLEALN